MNTTFAGSPSPGIREIVKPSTILLVDDDDYILKFIVIMLRSIGYQVLTAANGVRGLEIIRSGIIDLVVTDLIMPELDGITFIKQIRTFSKLPIIVLSACESDQMRLEALKSGATDYFSKPFDPKTLAERVAERLNAGG
jgi:DNA-binding response OmpR family regulator